MALERVRLLRRYVLRKADNVKKLIIVAIIFALSNYVLAVSNFTDAAKSLDPIISAIYSATRISFGVPSYQPGYGIVYFTSRCANFEKQGASDTQQIHTFFGALAGTIKGLEPDDYVALGVVYNCNSGDDEWVTHRVKFSNIIKSDKWEVWVNGVLQK